MSHIAQADTQTPFHPMEAFLRRKSPPYEPQTAASRALNRRLTNLKPPPHESQTAALRTSNLRLTPHKRKRSNGLGTALLRNGNQKEPVNTNRYGIILPSAKVFVHLGKN